MAMEIVAIIECIGNGTRPPYVMDFILIEVDKEAGDAMLVCISDKAAEIRIKFPDYKNNDELRRLKSALETIA